MPDLRLLKHLHQRRDETWFRMCHICRYNCDSVGAFGGAAAYPMPSAHAPHLTSPTCFLHLREPTVPHALTSPPHLTSPHLSHSFPAAGGWGVISADALRGPVLRASPPRPYTSGRKRSSRTERRRAPCNRWKAPKCESPGVGFTQGGSPRAFVRSYMTNMFFQLRPELGRRSATASCTSNRWSRRRRGQPPYAPRGAL